MDEYHEAMTSLAMGILRMLALTLELEESAFDAFCEHPIAILRLLHYPPQDPDSSDIERGEAYFMFFMISAYFSRQRHWRSYRFRWYHYSSSRHNRWLAGLEQCLVGMGRCDTCTGCLCREPRQYDDAMDK